MPLADARLEILQVLAGRFDHKLALGFTLDGALPAVRRRHRSTHVHARGQPLVHERAGELIRTPVIGHRGQDDDDISHKDLVLCSGLLYCLSRVRKAASKPTPRRAPRTPRAPRGRRIVRWLLLFVASLIVVDGLVGERGLLAMLRARKEYDRLADTIARQRLENAVLRDRARRLTVDPNAIEEVARRDLGLIKPGERVFIIKDVSPKK